MSVQPQAAGDLLSAREIRRRASAGLVVITTRGFAMLLLGFGGNIVLARMLVPRDFGLVALGATTVMLLTLLSDGGLGAGLIRRAAAPRSEELRAVLGLQLGGTALLGVVIALIAAPLGQAGQIMAVMLLSLPFLALQTPGRVVLERSLRFQPLAAVDVASVAVYFAWAIIGVAAGFGVWALATAAIARSAVGGVLMLQVSGLGFPRPLFSLKPIRPILGFGARFQGTNIAWNIREQGVNAATGALAGVATLGLWSLARRLLEMPLLLFESVWRVSFPSMSQLLASDEDPAPVIERNVARASIVAGLILTALAASAPGLVPGLFGDQWREAADVIPWACAALLVASPISMCTVGYLFAAGDAAAVLRCSILNVAACFAVTLPLLPVTGVSAIGIGWLAGSLVEAVALSRATAKPTGARLGRRVAAPLFLAVGSGAVGWLVSTATIEAGGLLAGALGGASAAGLYVIGLMLVRRALLVETLRFILRAMRTAVPRH